MRVNVDIKLVTFWGDGILLSKFETPCSESMCKHTINDYYLGPIGRKPLY